MKPVHIFREFVRCMQLRRRVMSFEEAEARTRTYWKLKGFQLEDAWPPFAPFNGRRRDTFVLPMMPAEDCPDIEMGQDCSFLCVLCSFRHECMYCAVKARQDADRPSIDWFDPPAAWPSLDEEAGYNDDGSDNDDDDAGGKDGNAAGHDDGVAGKSDNEASDDEDEAGEETEEDGGEGPLVRSDALHDVDEEGEEDANESEEGFGPRATQDSATHASDQEEGLHASSAINCVRCSRLDSAEEMIGCENLACDSWFHLSCAGVAKAPEGEWYCPQCRDASEDNGNDSEDDGDNTEDDDFDDGMAKKQRGVNAHTRSGKPRAPRSAAPPKNRHKITKSRANTDAKKMGPSRRKSAPQKRSSTKPAKRDQGWQDYEKDYVRILMEEILRQQQNHDTEKRWQVISDRLRDRYSIDRSWASVKNYWNRHGRADTGIDERRTKKPDRLVTGVQNPEDRRKARNSKRKMQTECEEDDDDVDSISAPRKRQKIAAPRSRKRPGSSLYEDANSATAHLFGTQEPVVQYGPSKRRIEDYEDDEGNGVEKGKQTEEESGEEEGTEEGAEDEESEDEDDEFDEDSSGDETFQDRRQAHLEQERQRRRQD